MKRLTVFFILLTPLFAFGSEVLSSPEIKVNLKNPSFIGGTVQTKEGGIVEGENLYLQAQSIQYINLDSQSTGAKKIVAEGNLLVHYHAQFFTGEKLEYDCLLKKATIYKGKTLTKDQCFVGGDIIEITSTGDILATNAFITTSEEKSHWWELKSEAMSIKNKRILSAKNVHFHFFKVPVFWLPKVKVNLKWDKVPFVQYKFVWSEVLKQKLSIRHEVYSNENFSILGRLDYRFNQGPGLAIETDYISPDKRTVLKTHNYGAHDKIVPQEKGNKRYRFQGLYSHQSKDSKTNYHLSYDRMSDDLMSQDFKNEDFELNQAQKTVFWVTHYTDNTLSRLNFQPRINSFQSINQQLPLIKTVLKPLPIAATGLIFDASLSAAYLDYVFAKSIKKSLPNIHAGRIESKNFIYRRCSIGPLNINPRVGLIGILYSRGFADKALKQGVLTYDLETNTVLEKNYKKSRHKISPYAAFQGSLKPSLSINDHYIFNVNDAYTRHDLIKAGFRNTFYYPKSYVPILEWDIFATKLFHKNTDHASISKLCTTFDLNRDYFSISGTICYNLNRKLFDTSNLRARVTLNQDVAFDIEMRKRSPYDWRKSDKESFLLESQRPLYELLRSPLSDKRHTVLSRVHFRLSPLWSCHVESHNGWGRANEPRYQEINIKLIKVITGKWNLEFGLSYDPARKWEAVTPTIRIFK